MVGLLLLVALPLVVIAVAITIVGLRRRSYTRDTMQRVGDESSTDAPAAARSAGGRAAWTRGDF